eukprot:GHUV01004486.1.p1 GENE.GHUV01004486.1~~GHUV01004486.1.p1  ORF type:complete len:442 (+),score=110.56 GHUV01004486.1:1220-2545(+)
MIHASLDCLLIDHMLHAAVSLLQNGYGSSSVINAVASDTDSFKDSIPVSSDRMIKVARSAVAAAPAPAGAGYEQSDENASPRSESSESAPLAEHSAEKSSKDLISSSFSELCNEGRTWSWSNAVVKIYRYTLLLIKQVYLLFMTLSMPTNHLMLNMRTLPRDFDEPNCNGDYLAAKFRNAVMPRRGRLHDEKSKLIQINRAFIETPFLGIPGIVRFIDVRTQWFDEGMQRAFDNGVKQVVVIAAGYDTRAYRLHRPGVRFYEIDLPHASKRKQDLVRGLLPASKFPRPEFVAADLSKVKLADALANTTFDPNLPTFFTAEGLIYYLPPTAVQQLLTCISNISAPGSHLMMDFLHLSTLKGDVWHPGFETLMLSVWNKGETMYSGIDDRPEAIEKLLRLFGFKMQAVLTARDLVKLYMPHQKYRAKPPTVSPYFGYIAAVKQ